MSEAVHKVYGDGEDDNEGQDNHHEMHPGWELLKHLF